jgi:phosphate:Na+ symporter
LIAILLLPGFLKLIVAAQHQLGLPPGAISLAAFHTAFIALGVVLFMPLARPFSRWIERLLPETGPRLTRHLDDSVLHIPEVALEASRRALCETAGRLFMESRARLRTSSHEARGAELPRIHDALEAIQRFIARIPSLPETRPMAVSRVAQMHAMDHLLRLEAALHPPRTVIESLDDPRLQETIERTVEILRLAAAGLRGQAPEDWAQLVGHKSEELAERRRKQRVEVLQQTAEGDWDPNLALNLLDTVRWLDRLGYHTWRICHYLHGEGVSLSPSEETAGATA